MGLLGRKKAPEPGPRPEDDRKQLFMDARGVIRFKHVTEEEYQAVNAPPEVAAPTGIVVRGPEGAGKTTVARALANASPGPPTPTLGLAVYRLGGRTRSRRRASVRARKASEAEEEAAPDRPAFLWERGIGADASLGGLAAKAADGGIVVVSLASESVEREATRELAALRRELPKGAALSLIVTHCDERHRWCSSLAMMRRIAKRSGAEFGTYGGGTGTGTGKGTGVWPRGLVPLRPSREAPK